MNTPLLGPINIDSFAELLILGFPSIMFAILLIYLIRSGTIREERLIAHRQQLMNLLEKVTDTHQTTVEQLTQLTQAIRSIEIQIARLDARGETRTTTEHLITTSRTSEPRLARRQLLVRQSEEYDRKIGEFRIKLSGMADAAQKFDLMEEIARAEKEQRAVLDEINQIDSAH